MKIRLDNQPSINARKKENSCELPPDVNHTDRLKEDRIALSYCEK